MVELVVAQRYGTALFQLALEENQIDKMEQDIVLLKDTFANEKDLMGLISNPQIPISERKKIIEEVFSGNVSKDLLGLIDLTIQKKREDILPQIFEDFLSRVNEYKGILIVSVTVFNPLTNEQEKALINKLEKATKKTIQLEQKIDKSLIGGMVIRIGDRILNNSIKGMIENMSKNLLSTKIWNYKKGGVTF